MIFIKLIVLIVCINGFYGSQTDYCKICLNHTLCKYKSPGASSSCKSYDYNALLTNQDINELINRINERRNYVAMGYSKVLPQAANMKKIRYSYELANSAQRWVDQCDPSVHPDKEDQCRDLENMEVGQNIGSVMGSSPGLNVKSFIEMWFIQILEYTGSVSYFNQSQNSKTNHFTQLMWADTEFVGCGKAKFYIDERNMMLERLVCNFAPKGNVHGKPVYAIGYPGTQCSDNMIPDVKFKGLCVLEDYGSSTKFTTQKRSMSSLHNMLNLSNGPVNYDIDPIRNNFKQTNDSNRSRKIQKNPKTRHIYPKKNYAGAKGISPLLRQSNWNSLMNITRNDEEYLYQHERGHSHIYHGHEAPKYNYEIPTTHTNQDFRKYDYTTGPMSLQPNNDNYRKYNQNPGCTRRIEPRPPKNCAPNQCTRGDCYQPTTCPSTCSETSNDYMCATTNTPTFDSCSCMKQTCPPISTNCNFNTFCQCGAYSNHPCYSTICPGLRRQNNDANGYKRASSTFQYYDMIPNVVVRSGKINVPDKYVPQNENVPFFDNLEEKESTKSENTKYRFQVRDYLYDSFEHSLRKKRQYLDQITEKPFWEVDNFQFKKPSQLRSMKYTTLANKINKNEIRKSYNRELITPQYMTDYAEDAVTDKLLSFDELMHLRKFNNEYDISDFRRQGKKDDKKSSTAKQGSATKNGNTAKKSISTKKSNPTKKASTSTGNNGNAPKKSNPTKKVYTSTTDNASIKEYKAETHQKDENDKSNKNNNVDQNNKNHAKKLKKHDIVKLSDSTESKKPRSTTPTISTKRINYCTRKLTCTWTFFTGSVIDKDGNIIRPDRNPGSRTRPGYVEGCTRTSTCTRDFMERNKQTTEIDTTGSNENQTEDEDYCERRSLNVQRRNSDNKESFIKDSINSDRTDSPSSQFRSNIISNSFSESITRPHGCLCYKENSRKKRHGLDFSNSCQPKPHSYGDLYYLIINKILKSNQDKNIHKQCPCNFSTKSSPAVNLILVIYFVYF